MPCLAQQLKAAGVAQPLFDETAQQGLYQVPKRFLAGLTSWLRALRLAAERKPQMVAEAVRFDATAEA